MFTVLATPRNRKMNYRASYGAMYASGVATGALLHATFAVFGYQFVVQFYPNVLFYPQTSNYIYIIYVGYKIATSKSHEFKKERK